MSLKNRASRGQCRIIAGQWRGRKLLFNDAEGLRPTTDRVRETLFNWLQNDIVGSNCLDCFAGSGALGFEAASRGARQVLLLEKNAATVQHLRRNQQMLDAQMVEIIKQDSMQWLTQHIDEMTQERLFDIVFLDPPFRDGLLQKACHLLASSQCLKPHACIYIEYATGDSIEIPARWQCLKQKTAGQVTYQLLQNQTE